MAAAEAVLEVVELLGTSLLRTVEAKLCARDGVQCATGGVDSIVVERERNAAEGLAAQVTAVLDAVGSVITEDDTAVGVVGETQVSAVLGLRLQGSVVGASSGGGGRGRSRDGGAAASLAGLSLGGGDGDGGAASLGGSGASGSGVGSLAGAVSAGRLGGRSRLGAGGSQAGGAMGTARRGVGQRNGQRGQDGREDLGRRHCE